MPKDCGQKWWKKAKFGMFIHWGLYSQLAGQWKGVKTPLVAEWIMKWLNIPVREYEKIATDFDPVQYNSKEWVSLAKQAGMKYIVITAKHHDGFAMYHSKCSKYNIVDATPFNKDPLKELSEECQRQDIKLGIYYSQTQDWHHPDGYGYGSIPDITSTGIKGLFDKMLQRHENEQNFDRYFEEKCKPQIRELLTQYGNIGLIWFDTPMSISTEYSRDLVQLVKSIQPDCLVSGRIGNQLGDYMSTGDNKIPSLPYHGDWEVPATLNDTWGYKYYDNNWKTPERLIKLLIRINSRGGNYLLNIGPDGKGIVPKPSIDILKATGKWMNENGDSIYATEPVPVFPYEMDDIMFTHKPGKLFVHVLKWTHNIVIHCLANSIKQAYILSTGEKVKVERQYISSLKQNRIILVLPQKKPDDIYPVVCMETEEEDVMLDSLDTL